MPNWPNWLTRPAVRTTAIALACLVALAGGYAGAAWLIDRTRPVAVEAAEPSATPQASPTPEPSGPIVLHGTGDVNLDPRQLWLLRSSFDAPWSGVREMFRSDDLSIVNLECSPSVLGSPAKDKQYTFRCPRGFAAMLDNGVDVTNLANNHGGDYGREALIDGRDRLRHAGLAPVGVGRNVREANEPAIFERKGKKIAVLGFGGVVPVRGWIAGADRAGMADGDDIASMAAAVRAADAVADIVLVTIHWGAERELQPQAEDVARAHAMIDAGADAIFGHHAHVLQPLSWYKDRPIFFGLGNFVWPRSGPTAVAEVVFSPKGRVAACMLPATISGGRPTLNGPTSCR